MTISTVDTSSGPYVGNGIADTFEYDFKIFDKTQLTVLQTDTDGVTTTLTVDSDYTVTNVGEDDGGDIVLSAPLAEDYQLFIRANIPATQETDFESQGGFFPDVHEDAFDKLTLLIQQNAASLARAVRLSEDLPLDGDFVIDEDVDGRRNKVLRFDNDGNVELVEFGSIEGLQNFKIQTVAVTAGVTEVTVPFTYLPNTNTIWVNVNGAYVPRSAYSELPGKIVFDNALSVGEVTFFGVSTAPIGTADAANVSYRGASTVEDALDSALQTVGTLAELQAFSTSVGKVEYDGSIWRYTLGDYSSEVSIDNIGVYVKADANAATVGAWVRDNDGDVNCEWFGSTYPDNINVALQLFDSVYVPAGTKTCTDEIYYDGGRFKYIHGAGTATVDATAGAAIGGGTQLVFTGNTNGINFVDSALTLKDISIQASTQNANTGVLVTGTGDIKKTFVADNVAVTGDVVGNGFNFGFNLIDPEDVTIDRCFIYSYPAANGIGMSCTQSATVIRITDTTTYDCFKGVIVFTTVELGIEGVKMRGCEFVGATVGVELVNTAVYYPPHFDISHCHISAKKWGIYAEKVGQLYVDTCDIYIREDDASAAGVYMVNVIPFTITNNQIHATFIGDPYGVFADGSAQGGVIANNYISQKSGTTKDGILLGPGINLCNVHDNYVANATRAVNDLSSDVNFVENNYPLDPAYVNPNVTSNVSGEIDVRKVRPNGLAHLAEDGTTIFNLIGSDGQKVTLVLDGSITFSHNVSLLLPGGVNFNGVAGNTITFYKDGTAWREIGRTV